MHKEKGYVTGPNWVHISTIPLKLGNFKAMSKKSPLEAKHSPKWDKCVDKVSAKSDIDNAYAVCTAAMGASSFESREAISSTAHTAQLRDQKKESAAPIAIKIFNFRETSTDTYKHHLFKVVLIKEGMGNFRDRFFYTKRALKTAAERGLFNGVQAFADHPSLIEEESRPERSTKDIIGYYQNVRYEESDDGQGVLVADLVVSTTISQDWVMALLTNSVDYSKKFKERDLVGLSINASGPAESVSLEEFMKSEQLAEPILLKLIEAQGQGITDINRVDELTEVTSVDLVTKAGAGGRVERMVEGEKKK
jgi:hypothetical protein